MVVISVYIYSHNVSTGGAKQARNGTASTRKKTKAPQRTSRESMEEEEGTAAEDIDGFDSD